jgi:hypothetical protein
MALDERSRHELFLRLEEALGPEAATTLMEHLPPVGWADVATKRDLDHTAVLLRGEAVLLRGEIEGLRAEFYKAMAEQTRTILLTVVSTTIGAMIGTATLAFAAARLT